VDILLPTPRGYGYLGWHVQFEPKVVRSKTIPFWKAYEVYQGAVLWGRGGKGDPGLDSNPKPICETGAGFWQPGAGFSNRCFSKAIEPIDKIQTVPFIPGCQQVLLQI